MPHLPSRGPQLVAVMALALGLGACATRQPAPVVERKPSPAPVAPVAAPAAAPDAGKLPPTYTVKRGDTLVGIALQFGLDYRELAAWNNIVNPNVILVGQVLALGPPGSGPRSPAPSGTVVTPLRTAEATTTRPQANTETRKAEPRARRLPYSDKNLAQLASAEPGGPPAPVVAPTPPAATVAAPAVPPPPSPAPAAGDTPDWMWPAKGRLIATFTEANKGVDIAGVKGTPVLAAAPGRVVYAGQGLRGYGKLVIIRHSELWLSAYAHNDQILVREQQEVTRGQKIAEMGATDAEQVKLHFEIRRQGRPVDPLKHLPAP